LILINIQKSADVKKRRIMTTHTDFYDILLKSDYKPLFNREDCLKNNDITEYPFKHKKCNKEFKYNLQEDRLPICPHCYNKNKKNYINELSKFLSKYEPKLNSNDTSIYLPNQKLVIEVSYLYHNTDRHGYFKTYFIDKKKSLLERGVNYFNIMEDELINSPNIIKSMCLNKIYKSPKRVFARKCKIGKVSNTKMKLFLNENHLQGHIHSKYAFGLYYKLQLVSLITLGQSRYNKNYTYEIHRFCSRLGYNVVGGFSKLLKYAINQLGSRKIITYVDLRHGTGNVYNLSGFKFIRYSNPNYFYITDYNRQSRVQYQKHKLTKKLKLFDPNLTEWQNMQLNGYDRIWDCGNNVFAL